MACITSSAWSKTWSIACRATRCASTTVCSKGSSSTNSTGIITSLLLMTRWTIIIYTSIAIRLKVMSASAWRTIWRWPWTRTTASITTFTFISCTIFKWSYSGTCSNTICSFLKPWYSWYNSTSITSRSITASPTGCKALYTLITWGICSICTSSCTSCWTI